MTEKDLNGWNKIYMGIIKKLFSFSIVQSGLHRWRRGSLRLFYLECQLMTGCWGGMKVFEWDGSWPFWRRNSLFCRIFCFGVGGLLVVLIFRREEGHGTLNFLQTKLSKFTLDQQLDHHIFSWLSSRNQAHFMAESV